MRTSGLQRRTLVRRTWWLQITTIVICSLSIGWGAVHAETFDNQLPNELSEMGVTEHLGEHIPLDLQFRDEAGRIVTLSDFFSHGRPVILSLNYSNCPMLCSLQLSGLVTALKDVELTCGRDFEFVSVSIDPQELTTRAAQTRQRYYQMYDRSGTGAGWHFLVGSQKSITALTAAMGVTYRYLKSTKEYVHPAVCACVTPDGRMSRYLYGVAFDPQTVRLSLVEASEGKIGTTLDQILLFCFHYDAEKGRYAPTARRIMMVSGAVTTLALAIFLLRLFRKEIKLRQLSSSLLSGAVLSPGKASSLQSFGQGSRPLAVHSAVEVAESSLH